MIVQFHRLARAEMHRSARAYESQRPGLGDRFYDAIAKAIRRIKQFPQAHPALGPDCRRILIARFPYALVYGKLSPSQIVIVAVAHFKRLPRYWKRRLSGVSRSA